MIERYSRPEMKAIWDERNKYLTWLKVEVAVCEELARDKRIRKKEWDVLKKKLTALVKSGGVDPERVEELERVNRHDVIAFTEAVAEKIGPESRYVHFGLTSSDVLDTALALQVKQAGEILVRDIRMMLGNLKKKAQKYKKLPTIGRSHGISAEPTSFGLKFLSWYCEWERNLDRLEDALERIRTGKLSGAVGVNAHWGPQFEIRVLKRLGLRREPVATQVVPRDRHAEFLSVLALCGASLERISLELRHLQRTEVGEVQEGFRKGQKGSSAMPHKRNPISTENLTGCARILRSYAVAGIENVALWHERDISHSSVERIVFPDATILLDYALNRMNGVLTELVVKEKAVEQNLSRAGETVYSGHYLLALVQAGVTREEAYRWVQECAIASIEGKGKFAELLSTHPRIKQHLSAKDAKKLSSIQYQLRNVPEIFRQVLGG